MAERNRNLVVRVDDETLDMVHAVAESDDVPVTQVVRSLIRGAYRARFGDAKPPRRTSRTPLPQEG
jgi:hypothetical protein